MRIDVLTKTGDGAGGGQVVNLTNCVGNLSTIASVIFVSAVGASGGGTYFTTDTYDADQATYLYGGGAQVGGQITTLGAGSFKIDGNCNISGVVYVILVLQYDGITQDLETGTYTGNLTDDQDGLWTWGAWVPEWVQTVSEAGSVACWRTDNIPGDSTSNWTNNAAVNNAIQSVNSGYCQLGDRAGWANNSGETYHWFVAGLVPGYFNTIRYTGDGNDPRVPDVTGAGFQPELIYDKNSNGNEPVGTQEDMAIDDTFRFRDQASVFNRIKAIKADGFEVGSDAEVNTLNFIYDAFVFKAFAGAAAGGVVPLINAGLINRGLVNGGLIN